MFDPICELKKYGNIDFNQEPGSKEESAQAGLLAILRDEIGRLSRGQFRMTQKLEDFSQEIVEAVENNTGRLGQISGMVDECRESRILLEKELRMMQKEAGQIINAYVTSMDLFDLLTSHLEGSGNESWMQQARIAREKSMEAASYAGIRTVGFQGEFFNDQIHEAMEAVSSENHRYREIVDVLAKGYLYRDVVLRKAKVIVNNKKGAETADEEMYWD